jgi:hypothetical protein
MRDIGEGGISDVTVIFGEKMEESVKDDRWHDMDE